MNNKQAEQLKNIPDHVLVWNVWLTQGIVLIISVVAGFILFDEISDFIALFRWDAAQIILYGLGFGTLAAVMDMLLTKRIPPSWTDDGGINERIFRGLPAPMIFLLSLTVAVCEEVLFRGIIQYHTNIWMASLIFALVHFRYLHKAFLFSYVCMLSLFLGWLFYLTDNLLVTIVFHFMVDFLLGLEIRRSYKKQTLEIESEGL